MDAGVVADHFEFSSPILVLVKLLALLLASVATGAGTDGGIAFAILEAFGEPKR
jgi:uncharacterized membrane protein YciS (DUF1049 family)